MGGWRGGSVVETKVNPLQNVQEGREGGRDGGRDHPGAQRFCCPQLLEKLGSAHDLVKLCNYSNAHSESGWVFFLLQKILILTHFIFFQKVTCGQHSCCFPAPLHKQSSVAGGGKWNSRNSFSVSAPASSFREKHVKQKVLSIEMKIKKRINVAIK